MHKFSGQERSGFMCQCASILHRISTDRAMRCYTFWFEFEPKSVVFNKYVNKCTMLMSIILIIEYEYSNFKMLLSMQNDLCFRAVFSQLYDVCQNKLKENVIFVVCKRWRCLTKHIIQLCD